jgi:hypothetical protein
MVTSDPTSFRESDRNDGSGKTDTYFNSPGDGDAHGHVVSHQDSSGQTSYDYARDTSGTEYDVGSQ